MTVSARVSTDVSILVKGYSDVFFTLVERGGLYPRDFSVDSHQIWKRGSNLEKSC